MKVKVISRNPREYLRETKLDLHKVPRNYDPKLHPFDVCREYQRALNSVKLEKVFAKPFIGVLAGHSDVISSQMKHPTSLSTIVSGSFDGEIRIWNLRERQCVRTIKAHVGCVRGLCCCKSGEYFFSVDDNQNIKQWVFDGMETDEPVNTIIGRTAITSIDHHFNKPIFITGGEKFEVWEETRSEPIRVLQWGTDTINSVKFNPVETDICAGTASDRSITFYDVRKADPLRKVVLRMRSNTIAWNPMEAFIFTAANEDYDLYTFDMRNLSLPLQLHKDHVAAVIDVDYSPTGKEFVAGSYDKTIRIFPSNKGRSREVYHTKRMQRITSVLWSNDSKYIMSASDEMDIRLWKANSSEKLGATSLREDITFRYQEKLKEKYGNHPEIKRIARHRHVPKHVYHAQKEKRTIIESQKRREANRRAHSKPGTVPFVSERAKNIVGEEE